MTKLGAPALFFASGLLGLGYQVLWSKYLLDFIGASAYSYATVLAAFMGGLAAGGALLGRRADSVASPLRLFALLEAGVGVYALAFPWLLNVARTALFESTATAGSGLDLLLAKAAVAGALLLPPTILMGGTLPAMLRHVTLSASQSALMTPLLYGINAAGAVFGALGVAFLLLPAAGMTGALHALAAGNIVVAILAALAPPRPRLAEEPEPASEPPPRRLRFVWAALAVAGALSFALEVAWTRYLGIVLGSSTDSFAIILASFISGIAIGSLLLAAWGGRVRDPLATWGVSMMLVGGLLLAPLPLYVYLPWVLKQLLHSLAPTPMGFVLYAALRLALCVALLLPVAMLIGVAVPLAIRGATSELSRLGAVAGRAYAWNTLGNVVGALATGLVLLPAMGMERLLRLVALGFGLVGFLVIFACAVAPSRRRTVLAATALVAVVGANAGLEPWQTIWFATSPFRRSVNWPFARVRAALAERNVLLEIDDPAGHLMVTEAIEDEGLQRVLLVNGKPDASSSADMPTQVLSGQLPLLLNPQARDVLVIGLASGVTAGAVLTHPVERLTVVDIVAAMPRAAEHFARWNGAPLEDPRTQFVVADARDYLFRTKGTFDAIVSEPSNPWMAGTAALFTREFYERAAERLSPGGLFLQWVQAYEFDDELFAVVLRTFRQTFPHVYGFQASTSDVLLVGARSPLAPGWEAVGRRFETPAVKRHLAGIGLSDLDALLAFQVMSPGTAAFVAASTTLENTDDNRLLETRAPRAAPSRAPRSAIPSACRSSSRSAPPRTTPPTSRTPSGSRRRSPNRARRI